MQTIGDPHLVPLSPVKTKKKRKTKKAKTKKKAKIMERAKAENKDEEQDFGPHLTP